MRPPAAARLTSRCSAVWYGSAASGPVRGNPADLRQLDGWFHETLAQAAGSPSLTALLTQLRRKIEWMYVVELPARAGESWDEHGAVLDAVARGDAERARALMAAHVERSLPVYRLRRPAKTEVRDPKPPVNTARARP